MTANDHQTPILIAGAGPTGLVLALSLARRNIPFRLIDAAEGPGLHSRAMVVHARTLEFYRQFGFAEEVIAAGIKGERAQLREGGTFGRSRKVIEVTFGDIGKGLSRYPFPLAYPQDDHERFLIEKLAAIGVAVEWRSRLTGFVQATSGVTASLTHGDGRSEEVRTAYLCGCDGAHSAVRTTLGIGFPGGTYPQRYYVADVKAEGGFERDIIINLGEKAFALFLPVRSRGMQRVIGLVPDGMPGANLDFEDLRPLIEPLIDRRISEVNWFTTYRVHHRVAATFQVGRVFLLGDAGHLHSPAGGQGMNTGIGDAINLGWKLAMVVGGRAPATLLETYEAERIGFARTLVATTDRAFAVIVRGGLIGRLTRQVLMPIVLRIGTSFDFGRRSFFRLISQIQITYRGGPLGQGKAGRVAAGDRLPWLGDGDGDGDNFAPLASLDWQVHVYGEPSAELERSCGRLGVPLYAFAWSGAAAKAGLLRSACYLIRPDGHVALAADAASAPAALGTYIESRGLRLATANAAGAFVRS